MTESIFSVRERLQRLGQPRLECRPLSPPAYVPEDATSRVMLASETFRRHMTDEGWQLQIGLQNAGYRLFGRYLDNDLTDVPSILAAAKPGTVVVQDKREWDPGSPCCFDKTVGFTDSEVLARRPDVFKLTICKDAHQEPEYHRAAAEEIGCHGWITYYHPDIVCHLAPWIRREHVVRTYHSLDREKLPPYAHKGRKGCLISGAVSPYFYQLRSRLAQQRRMLPDTTILRHPGYHADGVHTDSYLKTLCNYRVSVCTASIFGYALRKIVESTAAGCIVVTDLPQDDVMPEIDGNLVRVNSGTSTQTIASLIKRLIKNYDPGRQAIFAEAARRHYDWRSVYTRLASDIEALRLAYAARPG